MKNIKLVWLACVTICCSFPLIAAAQDFDDLNDQADKEYLAKNYDKAIELSNKAISQKVNSRSYFIRADCYFSLKDYQAALSDFNTALTDYSNYYTEEKYKGRLYYWRGRCKQKLANYDDAITDFNTALSLNYEEPGYVYWNRGNCYYEKGKYQESDDDFTKAIDKISDTKDLAKLCKFSGDSKSALRNYADADKMYTKAINYDPDYYTAYWSRAYYRNLDLRSDDAIADYNKAISIVESSGTNVNNNDLANMYRNLALVYYGLDKNDEALQAINKALMADPNYVTGFQTRADIYLQMKNYEKAKSDYNNAIILVKEDKAADMYFVRSYELDWKILDYKTAMDDLNKSISLDPKMAMKFWHRAMTYDYKKDYPKALADVGQAMQLYGEKTSSGLYTLRASLKEKSGDIKGAISDYQAALKLDNNDASIYYELGRLFKTKLMNNDLAETNLNKAMDLAKNEATSSTVAYARVVKGETKEAIEMILAQVEKYKDDKYEYKWQLHNAACIYALSGNKAKALEYLDKSMAAGFDDFNHLVNDRDLASLVLLPQYKAILVKYKVPQPKW